jgi:hypothetical protein
LTIRGAQLYGYLDGTIKEPPSTIVISKDDKMKQVENPTHAAWVVQDQQILGFLKCISLVRGAWSGGDVHICCTNLEGSQLHVRVTIMGTDNAASFVPINNTQR